MNYTLFVLLIIMPAFPAFAQAVRSYEGDVAIPTYEHSGRETEPPLFASSSVSGMYPFTTYEMPLQPAPKPHTYHAVFLENEYLKLTYIPDFGGRFFSVYDKLRHREMLYRNDVIKPASYNPRNSWVQSGMELTGPHDLHTLTLHGEPFWSHKIIKRGDGAISLVLGEIDPVYGMNVDLSATLHPGIAAVEIGVFCYNGHDVREPQMLWINTAVDATPKTRFIYPMSRTVGHTTAEVADWPLYNGIDYSWDRNNKHMLGVFGIDIYDNFQGAFQFDRNYGIFRFADRRIVQGMKLWTFGYGPESKGYEAGYTEKAGPYVELQSGRYVWDGHYEWVMPHAIESWHEWWIPVADTNGLTTLTRDVALNLDVAGPSAKVALAVTRVLSKAHLSVTADGRTLLKKTVDLDPAKPFMADLSDTRSGITVTVRDRNGHVLLDYVQPKENLGRKQYTPFTRALEEPAKPKEKMSVEELVLAGEYRQKELDEAGATALFNEALQRDPGYSRVHLDLGIAGFTTGHYADAAEHLAAAIARDPYSDTAQYYLALCQLALNQPKEAARTLYYIWPGSSYFASREYQLGRIALLDNDDAAAFGHFRRAVRSDGDHLNARLGLTLTMRHLHQNAAAREQLDRVEAIDPMNRVVQAERFFLTEDAGYRDELLRLLGRQTQEALATANFYIDIEQWADAARLLEFLAKHNQDPWGTSPEFFYTLAYCQRRAGNGAAADASLDCAKTAAGHVDRFPYRPEALPVLTDAVRRRPYDVIARFELGCLLYFRGQHQQALEWWEKAARLDPQNFSVHRALGLSYAEQGLPVEKAAAELERAVALNPAHSHTLEDLSALYARAGQFDRQYAILRRALERTPGDDDLTESLIGAALNQARYDEAEHLLAAHKFAPRHRTYTLREKFRVARYGEGSRAFHRGDYKRALELYQSALQPPTSLGLDNFQAQDSPRLQYYIGRCFDALGNAPEAQKAYRAATQGHELLSADRDSWNSENFFMVLALDRLGEKDEAAALVRHFAEFAATERDSLQSNHRAQASYLLALVAARDDNDAEYRALLKRALDARPDLLPARLALRGDDIDPHSESHR